MSLTVYIVLCSDSSYYTGVTNNVYRRLEEHNSGIDPNAYTFSRKPVVLKWQESFSSNMEAIRWEKKIKGWTRRKKEALIDGRFDLLHEFAKCLNKTGFENYGLPSFDSAQEDMPDSAQEDIPDSAQGDTSGSG